MPRRTATAPLSLALASPLLLLGSPAVAAPVRRIARPYDLDGGGLHEQVGGAETFCFATIGSATPAGAAVGGVLGG